MKYIRIRIQMYRHYALWRFLVRWTPRPLWRRRHHRFSSLFPFFQVRHRLLHHPFPRPREETNHRPIAPPPPLPPHALWKAKDTTQKRRRRRGGGIPPLLHASLSRTTPKKTRRHRRWRKKRVLRYPPPPPHPIPQRKALPPRRRTLAFPFKRKKNGSGRERQTKATWKSHRIVEIEKPLAHPHHHLLLVWVRRLPVSPFMAYPSCTVKSDARGGVVGGRRKKKPPMPEVFFVSGKNQKLMPFRTVPPSPFLLFRPFTPLRHCR